jgi:tripartite-type tricarboxylate transporter receptor subunit TctC
MKTSAVPVATCKVVRAAAFLFAFLAGLARAQEFPARPIELVVPFPAGGSVDIIARLVADAAAPGLGKPIIVVNRTGGGGLVGVDYFLNNAKPDGHRVLVGSATLTVAPATSTEVRFDTRRDFAPITQAISGAYVLVASPSIQANSVKELIQYVKRNPKLNYASTGVGTGVHLSMEYFKGLQGVELTHVSFKGPAEALTAMVRGDVHVAFDTIANSVKYFRSGQLRILAVTGGARHVSLPEVPTFEESGGARGNIAFDRSNASSSLHADPVRPRHESQS